MIKKEDLTNMKIADIKVSCDWEEKGFISKIQLVADILYIIAGSVGLFFNPWISVLTLFLGCAGLIARFIDYRKRRKK